MSFFRPLIREHFLALAENAGPAPAAINGPMPAIKAHLNENRLTQGWPHANYPAPQDDRILTRLSELYDTPKEHMFLTPGGDAGIHGISELILNPGDAVLVHSPTFFSYTNYARRFQASAIDVPLLEKGDDFELDTKSILEKIEQSDGRLKMVYICSPNNPTGSHFDENQIDEILRASEAKGIGVMVDEAYIEISDKPSFTKKLEDHPNLIVLRTLSKAYSLAGARAGALVCADETLIKTAKANRQPMFSLSSPSVDAVLEMIDPDKEAEVRDSWQNIRDQREIMRDSINAAQGMRAFQSHTNFILIGVEADQAQHLFDSLREHDVLANNPALFAFTDKLRISLGTQEENDAINQAFQAIDLTR